MAVAKTSKEAEAVTEKYVADLYGDVEYMCGGNVTKVRNALVRAGADRGSAMRPDIYNGVVSWVNPDGSSASFVSAGGAALVTVRTCVVRRAGYPALPWGMISGYLDGVRRIAGETDAAAAEAEGNAARALDALRSADLPYDKKSVFPLSPAAVSAAERGAAAVMDWNDANMKSYKEWRRLSADYPGICFMSERPDEWSHITDAADIDGAGENGDPAEQAWIPGQEPDLISELRRRIKRVSGLAGRDIMAEAESARYGFGGKGNQKNGKQK